MAPSDEGYRQNGGQTAALDDRRGSIDAWLDAIIYYGLGQHLLLALPMLWITFSAVVTPVAVTTSAIISLGVASITIGAFRMGALSVGPPWHRIDDNELGLGPDAGYGFLVRRAAYLNATLGLGTFAGALADAGGGGLVGAFLVAGGFAFGAILALPSIRVLPRTQSVVIRTLYYVVSLAVVAGTTRVLDLSIGMPSAALAFGVVCAFAIFDVGMDLR
ncbi:hypothetical protein GJR96_13945 [Haloferax sp. MBLA0076]|uniref:DUF8215 domain-containing protein n=1 Tax=Haloferax litoreum TaxID=2666140 RepID=A0A6A8GKS6_9EURY|nr:MULTISPECIES: hypothetical protein [Haloferax]KAB1194484.1 hypothetical protein Hfx1148_13875 [Haloferax sp. CBA1148]MRX23052.1 hypothetical protein [Haloferax litoreum]